MQENLLKIKFPEIFEQLDFTKNAKEFPNINLDKITYGSKRKLWWVCEIHGSYLDTPNHRTNMRTKCPKCSRLSGKIKLKRKLLEKSKAENRLLKDYSSKLFSEINIENTLKYFPNIDIDNFTISDKRNIFWNCEIHGLFRMPVNSRVYMKSGCQLCAKEKRQKSLRNTATKKAKLSGNTLKLKFPELFSEIDFERSKKEFLDLDIENIPYSSNVKIYWICPRCGKSYLKSPNARTNLGETCNCNSKNRSIPELAIYEILKDKYDNSAESGTKFNGKECDIYSPKYLLFVEYDGNKWHENKRDYDLQKSKYFSTLGKSIRILETNDSKKYNEFSEIIDGVKFYYISDKYSSYEYYERLSEILVDITERKIQIDPYNINVYFVKIAKKEGRTYDKIRKVQ